MKNRTLALLLLTCFVINCFAQKKEIKKIKFDGGGNFINLYKSGLAINNYSTDPEQEMVFYDVNLKKKGIVKYSLDGKKESIKSLSYDSTLNKVLVFHGTDEIKNLTVIDPETKKSQMFKIKSPTRQKKLGDVIYSLNKTSFILSSSYSNENYNIHTIDIKTGEIINVELPEVWKKRTILRVIKANSDYLAVCYKEKKIINIALLDGDGTVVEDKILTNNESDFTVDPFIFTDLGNDEFAILGNYREDVSSNYILGMFVAKVKKTQVSFIKYIEFDKINNFYNYLPDKKKAKVERRKSVNYVTLYHQVLNLDGSLVVSAEFFYPTYKTFNNSNGNPAFDGYQYTHSVILGLSPKGEKEFDHCIPFHLGYKALRVNQKLSHYLIDGAVKFGYISTDKSYSFILQNGKIEPDYSQQEVMAEKDEEDKDHIPICWYNNYFYHYVYTPKKDGQDEIMQLIKWEIE